MATCALPGAAIADSFTPVSVGLQASSLGLGVTLERPLLFNFSVRLATGLLSTGDQTTIGGTPWARSFRQQNVLVAADWRPDSGRYRLSGGLLFSGDRTTYIARSLDGSTYTLNGSSYATNRAGVASAQVSYGRPTLYAGVGAGTGITRGFTLAFDAGLVLRNGSTTASGTGPLQNDPGFQRDLQSVARGLRTRWIQPAIDIGLVYRP